MKLTYSKGATINLGNYESARVDWSAEGKEGESIENLKETVNDLLKEDVERIQEEAGLSQRDAKRFTG